MHRYKILFSSDCKQENMIPGWHDIIFAYFISRAKMLVENPFVGQAYVPRPHPSGTS